jgi:hypothetical protein
VVKPLASDQFFPETIVSPQLSSAKEPGGQQRRCIASIDG